MSFRHGVAIRLSDQSANIVSLRAQLRRQMRCTRPGNEKSIGCFSSAWGGGLRVFLNRAVYKQRNCRFAPACHDLDWGDAYEERTPVRPGMIASSRSAGTCWRSRTTQDELVLWFFVRDRSTISNQRRTAVNHVVDAGVRCRRLASTHWPYLTAAARAWFCGPRIEPIVWDIPSQIKDSTSQSRVILSLSLINNKLLLPVSKTIWKRGVNIGPMSVGRDRRQQVARASGKT